LAFLLIGFVSHRAKLQATPFTYGKK